MADLHRGLIEFDIRTPCDTGTLVEHVRRSRSLGLPELEQAPERPERLRLIANGPSALGASLSGLTMACNGALKLFTGQGLAPTYWIACDPQELVADFLVDAPEATTYLVASKCHPAVFDRLKGRDIIVWHVGDESTDGADLPLRIPTATSVTLCAMSVAHSLGFRDIETWGWDGCYFNGADHAVPQAHDGQVITNWVGDLSFTTTPTWCAEAVDARLQLEAAPYNVAVHGGGMIDAILRLEAA
jgi:hypothetical protein